jgi:hypothetical protein
MVMTFTANEMIVAIARERSQAALWSEARKPRYRPRTTYVTTGQSQSFLYETDTGLRMLAQREVGPNAHVVAVDRDTGHIYVPIANLGGVPVLREIMVASTAANDGDD